MIPKAVITFPSPAVEPRLQSSSVACPTSAENVTSRHSFKQHDFTIKSRDTCTLQNQTEAIRHHVPAVLPNIFHLVTANSSTATKAFIWL
jgi:hypothetical protein